MERLHPRYATDLEATCDHPTGSLVGRTKNLSRGGLCMLAAQGLAAGTEVTTQIALMFAENQRSESLRLQGRIAWCTKLGEQFQLGIQFVGTNSEALSFLGLFMQFLEEGSEEQPAQDNTFTSTTTFHSEDHDS